MVTKRKAPTIRVSGKRRNVINFRLTDDERDRLFALTKQAGVRLSDFVRTRALA